MPDMKHSNTKAQRRSITKSSSRKSTFSDSSKKKLAPRSSLQFKVGPQFYETVSDANIVDSKGKIIEPIICPRIDRGFERLNNEWVGYKRNYFTLVSTFYFRNISFNSFVKEKYTVVNPKTGIHSKIKYFALRLVSKCADDGSTVCLVQHTAKRDRGPQFEPPIHPAVPSDLPNHEIIREAANVRNINKIAKLNKVFFFDRDQYRNISEIDLSGLKGYPCDKIIKVARYERIQFSSSINYKKPSANNKRFKLSVELVGYIDKTDYVTLAHIDTPPLIVRGRSPSNYSQASCAISASKFQDSTPEITNVIDSSLVKYERSSPAQEDNENPETFVSIPDNDNYEINNIFETSLDDFETFEILEKANRELSELNKPSVYNFNSSSPKKKKGRKPKRKVVIDKEFKIKYKVKKPTPKKSFPKLPRDKRSNIVQDKKILKELIAPVINISSPNKLSFNPSVSQLTNIHTENMHSKSPSLEPNVLDNYDFDSSIIDIKLHSDLAVNMDSPSFSNLLLTKSLTELTNSENMDADFLLMKNRCEMLERAGNDILENFTNFQSNPSDILFNQDFFGDGPSFIIY